LSASGQLDISWEKTSSENYANIMQRPPTRSSGTVSKGETSVDVKKSGSNKELSDLTKNNLADTSTSQRNRNAEPDTWNHERTSLDIDLRLLGRKR
jgi:hypothetical protein